MELKHTVSMMCSREYRNRFIAEYAQVYIRYNKLADMIYKYQNHTLNFTPTTPINIFIDQLNIMKKYLEVLEKRAELEHIYIGDIKGDIMNEE